MPVTLPLSPRMRRGATSCSQLHAFFAARPRSPLRKRAFPRGCGDTGSAPGRRPAAGRSGPRRWPHCRRRSRRRAFRAARPFPPGPGARRKARASTTPARSSPSIPRGRAPVGAGRHEHGLVAVGGRVLELLDAAPGAQLHAVGQDEIDVGLERCAWGAGIRGCRRQHAAGNRLGLENHRAPAQQRQEVGAGSGRPVRRRRWPPARRPCAGAGRGLMQRPRRGRRRSASAPGSPAARPRRRAGTGCSQGASQTRPQTETKRVAAADHVHRVVEAVLGDESPRTAGTLTPAGQACAQGDSDQRLRRPRPRQCFSTDVLLVLVAEVPDRGQHRVGRGLAQPAERGRP